MSVKSRCYRLTKAVSWLSGSSSSGNDGCSSSYPYHPAQSKLRYVSFAGCCSSAKKPRSSSSHTQNQRRCWSSGSAAVATKPARGSCTWQRFRSSAVKPVQPCSSPACCFQLHCLLLQTAHAHSPAAADAAVGMAGGPAEGCYCVAPRTRC